jgi:hypothetical protein
MKRKILSMKKLLGMFLGMYKSKKPVRAYID